MRKVGLFLVLLLVPATPAIGSQPPGTIGSRIDNFSLPDSEGKSWKLSEQPPGLLVVVFVASECPLAKLYGLELAQLAKEFSPRGVSWLGIGSRSQDDAEALRRFQQENQLPFPVLRDAKGNVADLFGAERTPEVFVLDRERNLRYRGRIDDRYDRGIRRPEATRHDLAAALKELLAGAKVTEPITKAPGCRIGRDGKLAPTGTVTYTRDIAPILQRHCVSCHRPEQIAPFSLTTYKAASAWAETMAEVIDEGRMPPWHANPEFGKFANDPRLSESDKQLFQRWLAAGMPEGNLADLPPPVVFPEGWTMPTPDQIVAVPKPFTVPAEGTIDYQYFEVDPGFREDKWIQAVEVQPSNRAVVHHATVFIAPPGKADAFARNELALPMLIASAAGSQPLLFPAGVARRVPAGSRFIFVMHYTPVGKVTTDQTRLGMRFADAHAVKQEAGSVLVYDANLCIPPNAANHRVEQAWKVEKDVLLLSLFPHMHLRGKSFRYDVTYPGGRSETLLDVPHYDFNWQNSYVLAEPKRLPAGSLVRCVGIYDNSTANPANPDPSATVRAGKQSWEEMFNGYLEVVLADQDLTQARTWPGYACAFAALLVVGTAAVLRWRRPIPSPVSANAKLVSGESDAVPN